jgi:serine O-acetyltransferase
VRIEGRRPEGPDADWVHLPDPIADAIKGLSQRIATLEQQSGNGSATADVTDALYGEDRVNRSRGPNPAGG